MRLAVLALACAGCSSLLGLDDNFHTPDAGVITNHVGVNGVSRITYHSETATQTAPEDLAAAYDLDAYTVDDAGVHAYPAAIAADGTFTIADVPATDYYLRLVVHQPDIAFSYVQLWHLTSHDIDLSTDRMGKPGAARIAQASPVRVGATLPAPPLTSGDTFLLYSSLEDSEVFVGYPGSGQPPLGVAALAGGSADWQGHVALDDNGAWLTRERTDVSAVLGVSVTRAIEAGHVAASQTPGVALPLSFALAAGAPAQATLVVDGRAYQRVRGAQSSDGMSIHAAPSGSAGLLTGPTVLNVTRFSQSSLARRAAPLVVPYVDPYPATWARSATTQVSSTLRRVGNPLTGTGVLLALTDTVLASAIAPPGTALEVPALDAPIAAPSHVLLDGVPFADRVQPRDRALRLAWDPIDGATSYIVSFLGVPRTGQPYFLSVTSASPEVVIPGGTLPDGMHVSVSISVVFGLPLEPAIRRLPARQKLRQTGIGMIYVSSTCGNGAREAGEDCDTAGPSATCNWDCSATMCGDGILDAAAGELCDLGVTSAECSADCKPVVCGDGQRDAGEACDDGNLKNGDGCSDRCDVELDVTKCGNGALDPGEDCDDGPAGSETCSAFCVPSFCGDGVRQNLPGRSEECDDGNTRSGDGCSADCRIERCGDTLTVFPETCDDGNTVPGDGCSATCRSE